MLKQDVDVLIVGGGLIGTTLLFALMNLGYNAVLLEANPIDEHPHQTAHLDARSLALAPASIEILKMFQWWPLLEKEAAAIHSIHVSEQHAFGSALLQAKTDPLGFVVEMSKLQTVVHKKLDTKQCLAPIQLLHVDAEAGHAVVRTQQGDVAFHAKLIVAADGADSTVRTLCAMTAQETAYEQEAIVTNIALARPHRHQAYERFTAEGPLALLPLQGLRMALVWAQTPKKARFLCALDEKKFISALQSAFGYRLGRFIGIGKRVIYPLRLVTMDEQVKGRVVFIGNAAHSLHPVAGQGFNLGLRDVAGLAQCIAEQGLDKNMLESYVSMRRYDQQAITQFTHRVIELFGSSQRGLSTLRGLGLMTLDNVGFMKRILMQYMRGYAGIIPDLVCGIPLWGSDGNA